MPVRQAQLAGQCLGLLYVPHTGAHAGSHADAVAHTCAAEPHAGADAADPRLGLRLHRGDR